MWVIYGLESTWGKNDHCKALGKVNGFGYRVNSRESKCFDNLEQVAAEVNAWLERKLQTHTLPEALCGYNLGFQHKEFDKCLEQHPDRPYYRNYLRLR